jgi:Luciferase-like monooxygenase
MNAKQRAATWSDRGKRADEEIEILKKIWTTDPVEFQGKHYRIAKSFIGPKSVRKPHPPIYVAAFTPSALKRVAATADAWLPLGIPLSGSERCLMTSRRWQKRPVAMPPRSSLLLQRAYEIHQKPIEKERTEFTGTLEQIGEDFATARKLGAAKIAIYAQFLPPGETAEDLVTRMEALRTIAK